MKPPCSRGPAELAPLPPVSQRSGEKFGVPLHVTHPRPWRPRACSSTPWQERRIEDFINLTGDERVRRYIGPGRVWTRAEAIDRFHAAADHWRTQAFGWRSVVEIIDRDLMTGSAMESTAIAKDKSL